MSDSENISNEELHRALFGGLIASMAQATMQHLGKLVNPVTNKTEVNLDAAQQTIDVIEMLAAKTKGNLDADESRFISQTLMSLRLNYVETAKAPAASKPAEEKSAEEKPSDVPPNAEQSESKVKFSKKYE